MNHHEALTEVRSGKLRPIYLIYGGEPFLEEELFREIRDQIVSPETADFNYHVFDAGPDQLVQALGMAQTQPFFSERRLVVVRDLPLFAASRKKSEDEGDEDEKAGAGDEALLAYLKQPVPSTCLVFLCKENVDSRKKVTKAVIATGGAVECKSLNPVDATMWAQRRAQFHGKKMGDTAARLLTEKTGTDLRRIDSELAKLAMFAGERAEISPEDVDTAVGGVAETEVFRLTEAVMLKQRARALAMLAQTLRQVDHPLQLLAALTTRYRQLLLVKALVGRGVSKRDGAGLAKMHPFAFEKTVGYVRSYPREELVLALEKLMRADEAIKSGHDPKLTLETCVVELMGA